MNFNSRGGTNMNVKLLTVTEAADLMRLRPSTVRKWVMLRRISCIRIGSRAVRISADEVERILREGLRPARGPLKTKDER